MEPKFASAYVRFSKDPLDDLADVHVVMALIEERKYALVVKPRWAFSCDEESQTVYCKHQEDRKWLKFVFAHKDEFWLFTRRFAEARLFSSRHEDKISTRMAIIEDNFRLFLNRGQELGWDTFHSGVSTSRARQNFKLELDRRAAVRWRTSVRGVRMAEVDRTLPSKKYDDLIAALPRRHANLLVQLRTNHLPLQAYLARIGKTDSATCPTCGGAPETVQHFLLACPTYSLHRAVHFTPLGFFGRNLATLLNTKAALRPLFSFINATGRLRTAVGALVGPRSGYPDSDSDDDDGAA
ncbi:hypothetical protein VTO73DRAFT_14448 [Trametes versicolor]